MGILKFRAVANIHVSETHPPLTVNVRVVDGSLSHEFLGFLDKNSVLYFICSNISWGSLVPKFGEGTNSLCLHLLFLTTKTFT